MAAQQEARTTFIHPHSAILPPPGSITIGEIDNRLIFITKNELEEKQIINNFLTKKGKIFKSIAIPSKYFNRYSFSKNIENNEIGLNFTNLAVNALSICYKYMKMAWNLSSPFNGTIINDGNDLVFKYHPSIAQQTTSGYYNESDINQRRCDRRTEIIKFDYHPLYRKLLIAFKNGIVFFDIKRNAWLSNTLQHELQTNITDFTFSHSGHNLAVICSNGIFLWELGAKSNGFFFRGELIESLISNSYQKVIYSPCDKYIAVYRINGKIVEIYNVYSNKMVYRHQIFYNIKKMEWIPSTKENKYCPLRLLFVTDSSYIFLLNMITFQTESFQCTSNTKPTQICVSKRGNGIIVVTENRYLYHISMKPFSEPQLLTDLYLDFNANPMEEKKEENEEKKEEKKEEEKEDEAKPKYLVSSIKWSPCDRRIGIIYEYYDKFGMKKNIGKFVSVWGYDFSNSYRLGFITHPLHGTYPLDITFRNHFNSGALMAICWNNGIISQHHLCFNGNLRGY